MKEKEIIIIAIVVIIIAVFTIVLISGILTMESQKTQLNTLTFFGKIIDENSPEECLKYYTAYQTAKPYDGMTKVESALKFDRDC